MFRGMNAAIAANRLEPVIDRSFDFADARAAYHHMQTNDHFGKIVVNVTL
jgi:NADPH:quinone reductase-like Zn-dependent oxidoreductase